MTLLAQSESTVALYSLSAYASVQQFAAFLMSPPEIWEERPNHANQPADVPQLDEFLLGPVGDATLAAKACA